jgi:hypothetical protein
MKRIFHGFWLIGAAFLLLTCTHDPYYLSDPEPIISANCSSDTVYFVNDVLPLIQSSCALSGCHNSSSAAEGVILTDYVNIIESGHVKPHKPKSSELYKVITGGGEESMPPSPRPQLTSEQTSLIHKWIDQGAWNLECIDDNCDTSVFTFSGAIWPTIQNKCLGCHSNPNPGAGILMTNYQQVAAIAADPRFMGAITQTAPYVPMPQNGNPLSDCRITQFSRWIAAGMPND